jgi:alcohol dehydrogenase (cytochrome c)
VALPFTDSDDGRRRAYGAGDVLYRFNTGGAIGGVITYEIGGEQYVAETSGNSSRTTWYTTEAAHVFVFTR